jgi:DNA ligase-associated metallophosphoesterase
VALELAGEELIVDAQRALVWPRTRTAFLADLHLGKSDIFRRAGIPIPEGHDATDLQRIDLLIRRYDLASIVVLGDFLHGRSVSSAAYARLFAHWRANRTDLEVIVVAGNHDRFDAFREDWGVIWAHEGVQFGPFICRHHPEPSDDGYVLAGHIHPVTWLHGPGRERLRVPVLWLRERYAVLPSFGSFTGGAEIAAKANDRLYAFAADCVWKLAGQPAFGRSFPK